MKKTDAIKLLGGDVKTAADALGVRYQAIWKWPDVLPTRIADRVLGAATRLKAQVNSNAGSKKFKV